MGDSYIELLIKQKTSKETMLKKAVLAVGIAICVILLVLLSSFAFVWLLGIFGLGYLWQRWGSIEYEYIYYNGEMDVDKIMGQQARKRVATVNAKELEVLAPTGSPELRPYQNLKVYDYSSNSGNKTYEVVTKVKEQNVRIIFEPNDAILQGMRNYAPRKVFL